MLDEQGKLLDFTDPDLETRVLGELERLLGSEQLSSSPKLRQLLRYIVTETLAGHGENLKAYTIAVDGMGRREDFCAVTDPYIRNLGVRLRRAVSDYYFSHPRDTDIQVTLHKGSYVPEFRERNADAVPALDSLAQRVANARLPVGGGHTVAHRVAGAPGLVVHVLDSGQSDRGTAALAAALSEEVVIEMRRFPNIRLYGPVDDRKVGELIGSGVGPINGAIQYALRGRVRSIGSEMQVTFRLLDPHSEECLWAQNYCWPSDSADSARSEKMLIRRVAVTLADWDGVIPALDALGGAGADPLRPLTPYQAAIKANEWGVTLSDSSFLEAMRHLKDCVEANPDSAICHAILSDLYFSDYLSGIGHVDQGLEMADFHARQAGSLDPACPRAHWSLGQVAFVRGDSKTFESEFLRAISLNPSDIALNASYGLYLAGLGETDRAMESFEAAMNLSGHAPPWAYMIPWLGHYQSGDYTAALADAESIATPGLMWGALTHAACFGMNGRKVEARAAIAEVLELQPDFPTTGRDLVGRLIRSSDLRELIFEGLQRAGLVVSEPQPPGKMKPVDLS